MKKLISTFGDNIILIDPEKEYSDLIKSFPNITDYSSPFPATPIADDFESGPHTKVLHSAKQ